MSKRIFYCLAIFLLFYTLNLQAQENTNLTVLKGATIYVGNGKKIENGVVIIEGDRFKAVGGPELQIPKRSKLIELSGSYIMPGLVDSHMHFFQNGFFDSRPNGLDLRDTIPLEKVIHYQKDNPRRYFDVFLSYGITAVYDVGDYPWTLELQLKNENDPEAPHVASAGPLITPFPMRKLGVFNIEGSKSFFHMGSKEEGRNAVIKNSEAGATGIKIMGFPAEDPEFIENIKIVSQEIERQDNKMLVHVQRLANAKKAVKLGANYLVHSVADTLVDGEFIDVLTNNRVFYNPTMVVSRGRYNAYKAFLGSEFEIEDPKNAIDKQTRDKFKYAVRFQKFVDAENIEKLEAALPEMDAGLDQKMQNKMQNLKKVYDAGGMIVVGTDAGNPGILHGISYFDEIEAMQSAGIPAEELIIMATKNGAEVMQRLEDFGTLEKGKIADLIILQKDPGKDIRNLRTVNRTMRAGEFYSSN